MMQLDTIMKVCFMLQVHAFGLLFYEKYFHVITPPLVRLVLRRRARRLTGRARHPCACTSDEEQPPKPTKCHDTRSEKENERERKREDTCMPTA
jgi:hypothetical protein